MDLQGKRQSRFRFLDKGFSSRVLVTLNMLNFTASDEVEPEFRTVKDVALLDLLPDEYAIETFIDPAKENADKYARHAILKLRATDHQWRYIHDQVRLSISCCCDAPIMQKLSSVSCCYSHPYRL